MCRRRRVCLALHLRQRENRREIGRNALVDIRVRHFDSERASSSASSSNLIMTRVFRKSMFLHVLTPRNACASTFNAASAASTLRRFHTILAPLPSRPLPRSAASTLPPPRFHAASAASTLPPPLPRSASAACASTFNAASAASTLRRFHTIFSFLLSLLSLLRLLLRPSISPSRLHSDLNRATRRSLSGTLI